MVVALSLSVCEPSLVSFSTCLWLSPLFFLLIRLISTLPPAFFFSFSCNISNVAVLVRTHARGGAFFGPQGVETDGATKNLERVLSSLLELVARGGELADRCLEVEAEEGTPLEVEPEEGTPLEVEPEEFN